MSLRITRRQRLVIGSARATARLGGHHIVRGARQEKERPAPVFDLGGAVYYSSVGRPSSPVLNGGSVGAMLPEFLAGRSENPACADAL